MVKPNDIPPALHGITLSDAIKRSKTKRKAIAEGLLYEQTINMICADPGLGKSTISTQVAVELSSGIPVFGVYNVPRPMKVLYIQTERSIIELLERLEVISHVIPIIHKNLHVTDEYQKFNLVNSEHANTFLKCVMRDCPDVDVIFIDPIYCMVAGGLKEDLPASVFTKVMSNLQKETGAVLWYNHHTTKAQYTQKGDAIEKSDPFYGSQWIKAHVTGSIYMSRSSDGVQLQTKKDNYRLLPDKVVLDYDPQTELCRIPIEEQSAMERVRNYLNLRRIDEKTFTFKDIQTQTGVCTRRLRELLVHSSIKDMISVVSASNNRFLYKSTPPTL